MPGPIKGGVAPAIPYEKIAKSLDKSSEGLKEAAKALQKSSARGADAFADAQNAGAEALSSTGKLAEGLAEAPPTGGVAGWQTEGIAEGGRYVAKGAARGLSSLASSMGRVLGEGKLTTVRELQRDPNGVGFSEKLLGRAAKPLQRSADAMSVSWASYTESIAKLAGFSTAGAAGHVVGVADSLAKAAALTTSSSIVKMAEFGAKLANAALDAADAGATGAGDLVNLSAKFAAATANVLTSQDLSQLQGTVKGQLAQAQGELQQLVLRDASLAASLKSLLPAS